METDRPVEFVEFCHGQVWKIAPGLAQAAGPVHGVLAPLHLALRRHHVGILAVVPKLAFLRMR